MESVGLLYTIKQKQTMNNFQQGQTIDTIDFNKLSLDTLRKIMGSTRGMVYNADSHEKLAISLSMMRDKGDEIKLPLYSDKEANEKFMLQLVRENRGEVQKDEIFYKGLKRH